MLIRRINAARHDCICVLPHREARSTPRVHGLRKSGEIFPLELNVKSTTSDFGAMSTYLGFCRDHTR